VGLTFFPIKMSGLTPGPQELGQLSPSLKVKGKVKPGDISRRQTIHLPFPHQGQRVIRGFNMGKKDFSGLFPNHNLSLPDSHGRKEHIGQWIGASQREIMKGDAGRMET
jgi:hypothetical protein